MSANVAEIFGAVLLITGFIITSLALHQIEPLASALFAGVFAMAGGCWLLRPIY